MIERKATYRPLSPQEQFIVPLLRQHIEAFLETHLVSGQRVLDIGCGRQPFRAQIEARGCSYVGLDVEQNSEGTVDIISPIDAALPSALSTMEPFPVILCTEVLEHVADWDAAFRNLAALTAPGGCVFITCPHFYPLHEEPHDYWRPTPYALQFFAERAGLSIREQIQAGDVWHVVGTMLACCWPAASGERKLKNRVVRVLVKKSITLLGKMLRKGELQRTVPLQSPFYLSNVVTLEKL